MKEAIIILQQDELLVVCQNNDEYKFQSLTDMIIRTEPSIKEFYLSNAFSRATIALQQTRRRPPS